MNQYQVILCYTDKDVTEYAPDLTHLELVLFLPTHDPISAAPPVVERFDPSDYQECAEYDIDPNPEPFPLIVADFEQYELKINEYGIPIYWSKITGDASPTPVHSISRLNYHVFLSIFIMSVSTVRPTTFKKAFALPDWHPPIFKEMDNFIHCFHWIKDVGQRRLFMMWLFSIKADMSLKVGVVSLKADMLVVRGDLCQPVIDYNPEDVYYGNVTAPTIKIFFALSALYGLILRGRDLVGAYLVTPGSISYSACPHQRVLQHQKVWYYKYLEIFMAHYH